MSGARHPEMPTMVGTTPGQSCPNNTAGTHQTVGQSINL